MTIGPSTEAKTLCGPPTPVEADTDAILFLTFCHRLQCGVAAQAGFELEGAEPSCYVAGIAAVRMPPRCLRWKRRAGNDPKDHRSDVWERASNH